MVLFTATPIAAERLSDLRVPAMIACGRQGESRMDEAMADVLHDSLSAVERVG